MIGADKRIVVRRLIDEGRLTTAYQPIWDISKGTLLGVEALARPDADYGLSGPAEAFDIAEQMGRVHDLDVLCVKSALAGAPDLPEARCCLSTSARARSIWTRTRTTGYASPSSTRGSVRNAS